MGDPATPAWLRAAMDRAAADTTTEYLRPALAAAGVADPGNYAVVYEVAALAPAPVRHDGQMPAETEEQYGAAPVTPVDIEATMADLAEGANALMVAAERGLGLPPAYPRTIAEVHAIARQLQYAADRAAALLRDYAAEHPAGEDSTAIPALMLPEDTHAGLLLIAEGLDDYGAALYDRACIEYIDSISPPGAMIDLCTEHLATNGRVLTVSINGRPALVAFGGVNADVAQVWLTAQEITVGPPRCVAKEPNTYLSIARGGVYDRFGAHVPVADLMDMEPAVRARIGHPVPDWSGVPAAIDPDAELWGTGDLALALGGDASSFIGEVLMLASKARATPDNYLPLRAAFPRVVIAWEIWHQLRRPTGRTLRLALDAIRTAEAIREQAAAEGRTAERCPECGAEPGARHTRRCELQICLATGLHVFDAWHTGTSSDEHDCGRDVWPGFRRDYEQCRAWGWWAHQPDGPGMPWVSCDGDTPGARPDLNRLALEAIWDSTAVGWTKR